MSELLQKLEEKKRFERLRQLNESGRARLNQIETNTQKTQWSGNLKDLEGVSKTVKESILSVKELDSEYNLIVDKLDIIRTKELEELRTDILSKYNMDVYFVRKFSRYTELLGQLSQDAQIKRLKKDVKGSTVKFMDGGR